MKGVKYDVKICSWNINGNVSKLENLTAMLVEYDIIFLQEIKTAYPFSVTGFPCIRSLVIDGEELRGGVAVLIKNYIYDKYLYDVNQLRDQVWFRLHLVPDFLFGAVYIAPLDSPYFNQSSFAKLQEQALNNPNSKLLIMGDFNARIGSLSFLQTRYTYLRYSKNPDLNVNNHGKVITEMLKTLGIVPVNHLMLGSMIANGGLTFRQGSQWKSQLDWALCSVDALFLIKKFNIDRNLRLPSKHALISIEIEGNSVTSFSLMQQAKLLKTTEEEGRGVNNDNFQKMPVKFNSLDVNKFQTLLPDPWSLLSSDNDGNQINELCNNIEKVLYNVSVNSKCNRQMSVVRNNENRWKWLLEQNDIRKIWQSVNWKGTFDNKVSETPSDLKKSKLF